MTRIGDAPGAGDAGSDASAPRETEDAPPQEFALCLSCTAPHSAARDRGCPLAGDQRADADRGGMTPASARVVAGDQGADADRGGHDSSCACVCVVAGDQGADAPRHHRLRAGAPHTPQGPRVGVVTRGQCGDPHFRPPTFQGPRVRHPLVWWNGPVSTRPSAASQRRDAPQLARDLARSVAGSSDRDPAS